MRSKWIIIISRILCLTLLFRTIFLSLRIKTPSVISINHFILAEKKDAKNYHPANFNLKTSTKQLVNNINSILHFFKNRIAENKKLMFSFLLFLINFVFLFSSFNLNTKLHLFNRGKIRFTTLKKYIFESTLRI